jgi:chemotaxis signal transduction protein
VVKIPVADVEVPPAIFQEGGLNCVTGLAKVKGRLIVLLDMGKLLAPASLLQQKVPAENKPAKAEARGASGR